MNGTFAVMGIAVVGQDIWAAGGARGDASGAAFLARLSPEALLAAGRPTQIHRLPVSPLEVRQVLAPSYICAGAAANPATIRLADGRAWPAGAEAPRPEARGARARGFASAHFSKSTGPRLDDLGMLREAEAAAAPYAPSARLGIDAREPHRRPLDLRAKRNPKPANYLEEVFRARRRVDLRAWDAFYQSSVRDEMFGRPWAAAESAWLSGRDTFMKKFKPNVTSLVLLFSTADAETVFRFPAYTEALQRDIIGPLVRAAGVNESRVTRLQIARMPPRSQIKPHVDSGAWAERQRRVHVPLRVPAGTAFLSHVAGGVRESPGF